MFLLDGKSLSLDRAFTHNGLQYPANWLRSASPAERTALGITEAPDAPAYDQRFYWGPNNPKDHTELVEQWTAQVKTTAGSLLSQTDWYITRASETGLAAPQSVLERRSLIRAMSNDKEAFLSLTETTEQLAEYVTSAGFNNWESGASIDGAIPTVDGVTSATVITGDTIFGGFGNDTLIFN